MASILVVDDSDSVREMLVSTLTAAGHAVVSADHGRSAITALRQQPADLLITDIYMPELDGIELMLALRQQSSGTPIIAMSSKIGAGDMLRSARCLGARQTLIKPFTSEELFRAIDSILNPDHPQRSSPLT
jgi:two-component system, chemotaxis family, chemotaxis protein CheY